MTKSKLKTNWLYIVIIIFVALFVAVGTLIYSKGVPKEAENGQPTHSACLSDNETVDYTINWRQNVDSLDIVIKDKKSGNETSRFSIDSVLHVHYPVQPRKCGVYVLRIFNYDPTDIIKSAKENIYEIWYYSYNGEGKPFFLLNKDFSLEFKTDFLEVYFALIKGYLGRIDFATVIKEIKSKEDVFELLLKDITDKYPSLEGSLGLRDWTKDSRYFWADIFMEARVLGFFRIERDSWNVDIFIPPAETAGGAAFNPEYGYITYDTGPGWIGIDVITEQVHNEWRKEGKIVELHLYNLFTKKDILLATSTEPSWQGDPKWISDTELEYVLPTGEKKVYNIIE